MISARFSTKRIDAFGENSATAAPMPAYGAAHFLRYFQVLVLRNRVSVRLHGLSSG
jgi:hypothetical protein